MSGSCSATPPKYIDRAGEFATPEQYWQWFTELNPITVSRFEEELRALQFEPWRVALRTEDLIEYTPELKSYPIQDLANIELYMSCVNRKTCEIDRDRGGLAGRAGGEFSTPEQYRRDRRSGRQAAVAGGCGRRPAQQGRARALAILATASARPAKAIQRAIRSRPRPSAASRKAAERKGSDRATAPAARRTETLSRTTSNS